MADVFDLVAKIRLDDSEYKKGVGDAKGTFSTLASGVKTGLATVAKVGAAAVTAGVAGVTALTKMGVEGYAQYEQLKGGVETLFGTGGKSIKEFAEASGKNIADVAEEWYTLDRSQKTVLANASNAYKTAGMSANQYMETVTSFSASLIQSLGGDTEKAAEVADRAIIDMSDNANKMGTSMEMIQNAYSGFAKGNYTMLDNLKLGYGGTQEEMKRLIEDASKMKDVQAELGITVDKSSTSFGNVVNAISVMQASLGIAGATYGEAATTIEGSINMMKAAWQNLVVGMADENANMEVLINNFVESTATAAKNLLPRIEQTLKGIGDLITAMAPIIADALPTLVASVLPSLLSAGVSLITAIVKGVVTALPALYDALLDGVQIILVEVFGVSEKKAGEFADSVNSFFARIGDGFNAMVESAQTDGTWLNDIWTGLKDTGQAFCDFCVALWDALSAAFEWCVDQINTEGTLLNKIWKNIQSYITSAIDVIQNVIKLFTSVLKGDWSAAWEAIKNIVSSAWTAIKSYFSIYLDAINAIISAAWNGIKSVTSSVWNGIKSAISGVWDSIKSSVSNAINGVKSTVSNVWNGIKSTTTAVWNAIKSAITTPINNAWSVVSGVIEKLKNAFNFKWSLPSLKLPHISVSGGKAPYGIGGKGSLPKFNIEWYKKAYDNAMILSRPTIFGYSDGKFLGGGDGNGNEVVAGESYLMGLISNAVEIKNERIVTLLAALLEATVDGNTEMARALRADRTFAVGEREFARLVKQYA